MSITSANSILTLSVETLFPTPQQLQGFGVDDIYDVPAIQSVETRMGVDGVLSAGFVYQAVQQTITLQADSPSNALFDTWWAQMQAAQDVYGASGLILLPGISSKFIMQSGFLTSFKPVPAGKKTLEARTHTITWQRVFPAPA